MKISVELENNKQLNKFMELAMAFDKANPQLKLKKLKITFKYDIRSSGEYDYQKPNVISINPNRCDDRGDFSFYLICAHEFSHLIDKKLKIGKQFNKEIEERLYLTTYAKGCSDRCEELAEIISLYLRNPYLLKLISEYHYEFLTRYFNSPTSNDKNTFLSIYETYSPRYRKSIEKKYGFTINGNKTNKGVFK